MNQKIGIIFGVANEQSIAWGVCRKAIHDNDIIILVIHPKMYLKIQTMIKKYQVEQGDKYNNIIAIYECDVSQEINISTLQNSIENMLKEKHYPAIDYIVHSVAFASATALAGRCIDVQHEDFTQTLQISCYSLLQIVRLFEKNLSENGSIITMTYIGAQRVVPCYNVMGIAKAALETTVKYLAHELGYKNVRVNAVSSGPIKTLAAYGGIKNFSNMLQESEAVAPIKQQLTIDHVADCVYFLSHDASIAITGNIIYIDNGFHVMC